MSNSPITRTIKDIFDLKTKQNTDLRNCSIEGQHSPMVMTTDQLLWRQKTYFRGVDFSFFQFVADQPAKFWVTQPVMFTR